MTPRVIAAFECSDDALRFAKMKGEDYTLCNGSEPRLPWGVRPKSRREINFNGVEPPDSYIDEDQDDEC